MVNGYIDRKNILIIRMLCKLKQAKVQKVSKKGCNYCAEDFEEAFCLNKDVIIWFQNEIKNNRKLENYYTLNGKVEPIFVLVKIKLLN